jgi:hypothetical protein
MKTLWLTCILLLALIACQVNAQDTLSNGKALNIPFKKVGLSIGNSHVFNGIRINIRDSGLRHINGLNLNVRYPKDAGKDAVVNGINAGFFQVAKVSQPITIGLFGAGLLRWLPVLNFHLGHKGK